MDMLLTTPEIARLAGVRPVTVRSWRMRYSDFPPAAAVYAGTPVYDPADIAAWLHRHRPKDSDRRKA